MILAHYAVESWAETIHTCGHVEQDWQAGQVFIHLNFLALRLLDEVIAAARGERHHRQRRVLISSGRECVATEHIQVGDVVRLAERVEDSVVRISTHACRSDFMDRSAQRPPARGWRLTRRITP